MGYGGLRWAGHPLRAPSRPRPLPRGPLRRKESAILARAARRGPRHPSWVVVLVCVLAGTGVVAPARAASTGSLPGNRAADVQPSQAQVTAARAAVAGASTAAGRAQAAYDAASVELSRVQGLVAAAQADVDEAEALLAQRTASSQRAEEVATAASAAADGARVAVRRDAALIWQGQGDTADLDTYLSGDGPQVVADRLSALEQVAARRAATLDRAAATAGMAVEARRASDRAREQQAAAARTAHETRDRAQVALSSATARATQLRAEQDAQVAALARLRGVAAAVEQQRQDALAAESARVAAERAAALEAARSAEAARVARAAEAARRAASSGPSTTRPAPSTTTVPPVPTTPPVPQPPPTGGPVASPPPPITSTAMTPSEARAAARSMMGRWGFGDGQWACLDSLWTGESGWRWSARNPWSSAYGIPQALPASKMSSAGDDWLTNPVTQISWGLTYIKGRYGSPCGAWEAWQARSPHWY